MRLSVLFAAAASAAAAVFFIGASPARAFDDINVGPATAISHYNIGSVFSDPPVPTPGSVYSNVDNFTGFGISNGGATVVGGLQTTNLLSDDLNTISSIGFMESAGWGMKFSVSNLNATATNARFRIRFFLRDGAGGAPGTAHRILIHAYCDPDRRDCLFLDRPACFGRSGWNYSRTDPALGVDVL